MLTSRNITFLLSFSIVLLIVFDSLQQKFYLDTFNLYPSEEISFADLLFNHFQRWMLWLAFSCFYGVVAWKEFSKTKEIISDKSWALISLIVVLSNVGTLLSVSALTIVVQGIDFSYPSFIELFQFMVYQKGLSFMFASCLLILLLYNKSTMLVIDAQWIEIKNLKSVTESAPDIEQTNLNIKIGNRLKVIPLSDVQWVEADDYCVKVHTSKKSYTMRKSLKSLEKDLAPYHFVRVHRRALLNLEYLEHVDFSTFKVKLQDKSEIPLSKSGAQTLKQALNATSI